MLKKRAEWKNLQTNISHFDKKAVHLLRLSSPDAISVAADAGKRTANAELNCKVLIWKQREKKPVIAGNGREESTDILKAFTQTLRLRRVESCKFKPIKVLNRGDGRCPGCGLCTINMVKVRIYCTLNGRIISLLKPY